MPSDLLVHFDVSITEPLVGRIVGEIGADNSQRTLSKSPRRLPYGPIAWLVHMDFVVPPEPEIGEVHVIRDDGERALYFPKAS